MQLEGESGGKLEGLAVGVEESFGAGLQIGRLLQEI